MSVHGEYNRALDTVVERLRERSRRDADAWADRLAGTRCGPDAEADLSTAARTCLGLVEKLESDPALAGSSDDAVGSARWRAALEHLRAHCHVILGVSDANPSAR